MSNHSPDFAPDAEPALKTAIAAEVAAIRMFFGMTAEQIGEAVKSGRAARPKGSE